MSYILPCQNGENDCVRTHANPVTAEPDAPSILPLCIPEPVCYLRLFVIGREFLHLRRLRVFGTPATFKHIVDIRSPTPVVPLVSETFTARTWRLVDSESGDILASQLRILRSGATGGMDRLAVREWQIGPDHRVVFSDAEGRPFITLAVARRDDRLCLQGVVRESDRSIEPTQTPPPPHNRLAAPGEGVDPVGQPGATRRRNLVNISASPISLHKRWPRDIDDADRP